MRTTVDIPDPIYRELKARAAREGRSVKEVILQSVAVRLRNGPVTRPAKVKRRSPPVLHAQTPGSLRLDEEGVYEYIPFP